MQEVRARQRAERAAATSAQSGSSTQSNATTATLPYEPSAIESAAAERAATESAAAKPDCALFNGWLRRGGYEPIEEDEWDEFNDDGAFDDAMPEDLQPVALIELFLEWRGSHQQQTRMHDDMVHEWNCSREALDREPPPPTQPRGGPPRCVECRRTECVCSPPEPDDPDDDNPWRYEYYGHLTPPPRSPDDWTPGFDWDDFCDREYARAAGELYGNWGDTMRPHRDSKWEQQAEERRARKERERASGPPPYREQPRFGPRGDAAGDELFRKERERWYENFTGCSIAGLSVREQSELCDAIARRFRAYTDGRANNGARPGVCDGCGQRCCSCE